MGSASPRVVLPESGTVLAGKYRITRRIGEGGMGVVYEALHTRIEQRVAIKMLLPEVLDVPDVVSRFEREARAAGKLRSENTARVLDVDVSDNGLPYMVMEYLAGSDLGKILERGGALPVADAVDYVLQACNAMTEAHAAGVIHRDLKPSNLFVTEDGRLKVLDFGISKVENDKDARVTATKTVVGTPLYMSPEQVRSAKHVDARSDIWSLGIILYELLCGRTPFEGSTTAAAAAICIDAPPPIASLRQGVPAALSETVMIALQKDPAARFQSVPELAVAIAPFGSGAVQLPDRGSTRSLAPLRSSPSFEVGSARTLLHSDPSLSMPTIRSSPGATLPGWTTRSTTRTRSRWLVVGGVLGAAFAIIGLVAWQLHAKVVSSPPPTAEVAAVPATVAPLASSSVPIILAVPSATVMNHAAGINPPTHTAHSVHPPATSAAVPVPPPTHTAAPIPTRL